MFELLDLIFEYRLLRTKSELLGIMLADGEQCRLAALDGLLAGKDAPKDRLRKMARAPLRLFVRFTLPGTVTAGELRDVSAGGARVALTAAPPAGSSIILGVTAPGHEYVFPSRVVWRNAAGTEMGIEFEGVPSKRRSSVPVVRLLAPVARYTTSTEELPDLRYDDDPDTVTGIKCKTPVPDRLKKNA